MLFNETYCIEFKYGLRVRNSYSSDDLLADFGCLANTSSRVTGFMGQADSGASVLLSSNEREFILKVQFVHSSLLNIGRFRLQAAIYTATIASALLLKQLYNLQALDEDHRVDGRRPLDYRKAQIAVGKPYYRMQQVFKLLSEFNSSRDVQQLLVLPDFSGWCFRHSPPWADKDRHISHSYH